MIDLHCHILPGIDDGAKDMETSLAMAREAVQQGITHIVCTPHHLQRKYYNGKSEVIQATRKLQFQLDKNNIPLEVYEGQEVHLDPTIEEELNQDNILFLDMNNRYFLLEFPTNEIPIYADSLIQDLIFKGKIPILVHPERYTKFIENPNLLIDYIDQGVIVQITAPSICGHYGKKIQKTALKMIDHNLGHIIASDAHNCDSRPFMMKEAYHIIRKKFGDDVYHQMKKNAVNIFNGDDVEIFDPIPVKKGWFK